jgi:hypothetical protein
MSLLEEILNELIETKVEYDYQAFAAEMFEDVNEYKRELNSSYRYVKIKLEKIKNELDSILMKFLNASEEDVGFYIVKVAELLDELNKEYTYIYEKLRRGKRSLVELCRESGEELQEFIPDLDIDEILEMFWRVIDRNIVDLDPTMIQNLTINEISEILEARIENFDLDQYENLSFYYLQECKRTANILNYYMINQVDADMDTYLDELSPLLYKAYQRYQTLTFPEEILESPQHQRFREYMEDLFE